MLTQCFIAKYKAQNPHRATDADGREEQEDHWDEGEAENGGSQRHLGKGGDKGVAAAWLISTGGFSGQSD